MSRRQRTGTVAGPVLPDCTSHVLPRHYVSAAQLTALTPWSIDAIEKMVKRGVFKKGTHFFQLERRGKLIFKWEAIVALIEGPVINGGGVDSAPRDEAQAGAQVMDVEKATAELQRLLD